MDSYEWRRAKPPARSFGYRMALLLGLVGFGLEVGGMAYRDVWFAFSGLLVLALGALVAIKLGWRGTAAARLNPRPDGREPT